MHIEKLIGNSADLARLRTKMRESQGVVTLPENRKVAPILAMAAGKPGSPFTRDTAGRLRRSGKFASVDG
jgi:hypothetical protein